jgi:hypothetical protein
MQSFKTARLVCGGILLHQLCEAYVYPKAIVYQKLPAVVQSATAHVVPPQSREPDLSASLTSRQKALGFRDALAWFPGVGLWHLEFLYRLLIK